MAQQTDEIARSKGVCLVSSVLLLATALDHSYLGLLMRWAGNDIFFFFRLDPEIHTK